MRPWVPFLVRRGAAQAGVLVAVLAVAVAGSVLLGTCALLLTAGQASALDTALRRVDPSAAAVDVSFRVVHPDAADVVADAERVVTDGLDPADPVLSAWATSHVRRLADPAGAYAYLTGAEDLPDHARLVDGRWPTAPPAPGPDDDVLEVTVPVQAADRLGLTTGARVLLEEVQDGTIPTDAESPAPVTLEVVGTYVALPDAAGTWQRRDLLHGDGVTDRWELPTARVDTAVTAVGPLVVDPDALRTAPGAVDRVTLHAGTDLAGLSPDARTDLRGAVRTLRDDLGDVLGDRVRAVRVGTGLGAVVAGAETRQAVTGSLVLVVALLGTTLTATALALAGRLVAARRAEEGRLVAARGATRGQLVTQAAVESAVLAVVAAALAVPLALALYRGLVGLPALAGAGLDGTPGVTPALVTTVLAGAVLQASVLIVPVWRAADRMPRGRPGVRGRVGRGAVVGLLAAAAVAGVLQLRGRLLTAPDGPDPVLVVVPVLVLVAGVVVVLRGLPWLAGRAERGAARSRRLVVPLATWEVARRPQATGTALLLALATAAATFGLALDSTWATSTQDQADADVGTDLAVSRTAAPVTVQAGELATATGGTAVPVTDRTVVLGDAGGAVAPGTRLVAPALSLGAHAMRGRVPDGADWPGLTSGLVPAGAVAGVPVDGDDLRLTVRGESDDGTLLEVTPQVTVQSPGGARETLVGGTVPLDRQPHDVVLDVPVPEQPGGAALEVVALTLRLALDPTVEQELATESSQVTLALSIPHDGPGDGGATAWAAGVASVSEDRIRSVTATGPSTGTPTDPTGGATLAVEATVAPLGLVIGDATVVLTAFERPDGVPVLVTAALAERIAAEPGDVVALDVGDVQVPAEVAGIAPPLASFPHGAALLADHDALSRATLARGTTAALVDTWWVVGAGDPVATAQELAGLGVGEPRARAAVAESLLEDPLAVGLRIALGLLVAAAVALAATGTVLRTAASVEARAVDVARLQGMGVPRRTVVGAVLLEHTLVSVLVVVAGAAVGAVAAWLVAPLLVVSPTGAAPVPPARPQWPWAGQGLLLAVLLVVCTAVVVPVAARLVRRATAAHLRADAP